MDEQRPKAGVGVMIIKDGKVLLSQRISAHGAGEYSFPGGHLEHLESFEACAVRETAEECGVEIKNIRFQFLANMTAYQPKHYVHIGLIADWDRGEPQDLEPDKHAPWGWYSLDNLPKPLFYACTLAIESYQTGKNYFDTTQ